MASKSGTLPVYQHAFLSIFDGRRNPKSDEKQRLRWWLSSSSSPWDRNAHFHMLALGSPPTQGPHGECRWTLQRAALAERCRGSWCDSYGEMPITSSVHCTAASINQPATHKMQPAQYHDFQSESIAEIDQDEQRFITGDCRWIWAV